MADFLADKIVAGSANYPAGNIVGLRGEYTVPAAGPAATETLKMGTIPKGAIITSMILASDGGTATMTITVGDGTTADLFMGGTPIVAAAAFVEDTLEGGHGVPLAADTDVVLTFGTAGPTEGDSYYLCAEYIMP